jgi:hypothetical protein
MMYLHVLYTQEAAEGRTAHKNGWNGIKHMENMWYELYSFTVDLATHAVCV